MVVQIQPLSAGAARHPHPVFDLDWPNWLSRYSSALAMAGTGPNDGRMKRTWSRNAL